MGFFYISVDLLPFSGRLEIRSLLSTFSIVSYTLTCVTSVPIWHPFRHALKYAVICPISSIYPELCYISASLAPFLARLKIRSDLSSFSIMPFTVSCVTPVPVLPPFSSTFFATNYIKDVATVAHVVAVVLVTALS